MDEQSNREHEKFQDILSQFTTAMLVTRNSEGALQARPMRIAEVAGDADLRFIASVDSEKVTEVRFDPHVAVTCQTDRRYLSICGTAALERDTERARQLWDEAWRPWFPSGPEDPTLVFIHLKPAKAEYWDRAGINGLRFMFESARAILVGDEPRQTVERHGEVQF